MEVHGAPEGAQLNARTGSFRGLVQIFFLLVALGCGKLAGRGYQLFWGACVVFGCRRGCTTRGRKTAFYGSAGSGFPPANI